MEATFCCCRSDATEFDSLEAKDARRKGSAFLHVLSLWQILVSILSILVGIASIGVALTNPSYPKINGYGILTGLLSLTAGICGRHASQSQVFTEIDFRIRAYIIAHYTLSIVSMSMAALQVIFTVWTLVECLSTDQELSDTCRPLQTTNIALDVIVIALGTVILALGVLGSSFICKYRRPFGFLNKQERIEKELEFEFVNRYSGHAKEAYL